MWGHRPSVQTGILGKSVSFRFILSHFVAESIGGLRRNALRKRRCRAEKAGNGTDMGQPVGVPSRRDGCWRMAVRVSHALTVARMCEGIKTVEETALVLHGRRVVG